MLKICVDFFRFIYETESFNGVGELLEILGRYVYSFKGCPRKKTIGGGGEIFFQPINKLALPLEKIIVN